MFFSTWKPPADVLYSGNRWVVKLELAGISPDEVSIVAHGNDLHIHGRRRDLHLHRGFACHSLEIAYTDFERRIKFPGPVDGDSIRWQYRDGILQIQLNTRQR